MTDEQGRLTVDAAGSGSRLDTLLADRFPAHSRSRWQQLIREGFVQVNLSPTRPNTRLAEGDQLAWTIPEAQPADLEPEAIPLDILYEDAEFIAVNKPPGLVVHPAPGHDTGTLVHALLHHCGDLQGIGGERRPGIVHRLDQDTSGVLIAAKTEAAMVSLASQFKSRQTEKTYLALVRGHPVPASGKIETLIGRSTRNRKKMSATPARGKPALTHYRVLETFPGAALVEVTILTGRTHQIRVHMAHIGHAVLGDRVYGRGSIRELPPGLPIRQMLHAARLSLSHPTTGEKVTLEAPLPADFLELTTLLRPGA